MPEAGPLASVRPLQRPLLAGAPRDLDKHFRSGGVGLPTDHERAPMQLGLLDRSGSAPVGPEGQNANTGQELERRLHDGVDSSIRADGCARGQA